MRPLRSHHDNDARVHGPVANLQAPAELMRTSGLLALAALTGVALAHLTNQVPPLPAYAACGTSHGVICEGPKASLLEVNHFEVNGAADRYVEPDSGETWHVQAIWATTSGGTCACTETYAQATVRVDWVPATHEWVATCTSGCDEYGGPIFGFSICDDDHCLESGSTYHSWLYVLEGEIDESVTTCSRTAYLDRVEYTTTSVDDGDSLSGTGAGCYELYSISPTSQTFAVTDTGANQAAGTFVCAPSDCLGPTQITLTYD
jgi:hypothetical protein